jgi:hypothetical protein
MKKMAILFFVVMLLAALATAQAQQVNVTFRLNTCTIGDTVNANSSVAQIRGTTVTQPFNLANRTADDNSVDHLSPTDSIQWNGKSTLFLHNVGGDYWQGTFSMPAGTVLEYKFYVNASHDTVFGGADWQDNGWENDLTKPVNAYGGDRILDLSSFTGTDTTLDLQFYSSGWKATPQQYEKPYATDDSTNVIFVRVNLAGWDDFNQGNHLPAIRGGLLPDGGPQPPSPQLDWGTSYLLTQETPTKFFNTAIHVKKNAGANGARFKFIVHFAGRALNEDWSLMAYNPGAQYELGSLPAVAAGRDTTIRWVYFDNLVPRIRPNPDQVVITYRVDMTTSIQNRGFQHTDTLVAQAGFFTTAREVYEIRLLRQGFGNIYGGKDTIFSAIGQELDYQYYLKKGGQNIRESYFDFDYSGLQASEAERRRLIVPSSGFQIDDVVNSKVDARRQPFFRNTQPLQQAVRLTLKCDIRPAIFQVLKGDSLLDIQGTRHIRTVQDILNNGVWVNGPLTGTWAGWGGTLASDTTRKMYDDGTHGDAVAGDSIYTRIILSSVFGQNIVGQEFKFGINGGDNESGFGLNHIENVDDNNPGDTLDVQFGSINPNKYNAWDFDNRKVKTAVAESPGNAPFTYSLAQNYPNPFNPETTIQYSLAKAGKVTLTIYNVMGQKVRTLVDESKPAGVYTLTWNGRNDRNIPVSTGVYFYKINAGDFNQIKKLLFLK